MSRPARAKVPAVCRAATRLANEAGVGLDGPHPPADLEPSSPSASLVELAARATNVP